jgi:hypothetical protein
MDELKLRGKTNVRFVKWNEPEGKNLGNLDEEDLSLLIEFCRGHQFKIQWAVWSTEGAPSHSTFSTIRGDKILYHRYIIQITHLEFISPIRGRDVFEKLGTRQRGCVKLASGTKYVSRASF